MLNYDLVLLFYFWLFVETSSKYKNIYAIKYIFGGTFLLYVHIIPHNILLGLNKDIHCRYVHISFISAQ